MIAGREGGVADRQAGGRARSTPPAMAAIALLLVWVAFACGCLTAPQPGSLAVASEPAGAEVYLGGQYTGTAPLEITNLTPGEYVLRFRLTGYGDREVKVMVEAGNRTAVTARYPALVTPIPTASPTRTPQATIVPTTQPLPFVTTPPATGSLYLTSVPAGASVYVNGEGKGVTPVLLRNLTPGTYFVRFTLVGWKDYQVPLSVSSGQMMTEEATLKR